MEKSEQRSTLPSASDQARGPLQPARRVTDEQASELYVCEIEIAAASDSLRERIEALHVATEGARAAAPRPALQRRLVSLLIENDVFDDRDFTPEVVRTLRELADLHEGFAMGLDECDVYIGPRGTKVTILGAAWNGQHAPHEVPKAFQGRSAL